MILAEQKEQIEAAERRRLASLEEEHEGNEEEKRNTEGKRGEEGEGQNRAQISGDGNQNAFIKGNTKKKGKENAGKSPLLSKRGGGGYEWKAGNGRQANGFTEKKTDEKGGWRR